MKNKKIAKILEAINKFFDNSYFVSLFLGTIVLVMYFIAFLIFTPHQ